MTTKTSYLLGIFAAIVIGTLLYQKLCVGCIIPQKPMNSDKESLLDSGPVKSLISPFLVNDGTYTHEVNDNFDFYLSSPSFIMPISDELKDGIANLKDYLDSNPEKIIALTGVYTENEENNTPYANLGLARANSVKNHLALSGISTTQINTFGKLMQNLVAEQDVLSGPILYAFSEMISEQQQH
ncbi:OmpA family protein [Flagellimonas pacifica]|uniref:Outer membrane protein OmpA n=1 Tax=Flagellimonas pacifica TaxID=1247520 RepID=A0A285MDM3_9FLAO|nr:OmpA family protein [Allomuricauda parva]SNY94803.1 Outer membrane protein OmpA [Allomuricauda parva]